MYADFDLAVPETLEGALQALDGGAGPATLLAGGTNLIVDMRARREQPSRVVCIANLDELRFIECSQGEIALGGNTTVSDVLHSAELARAAPSLVESARLFGGQMVRNAATVAGNIASGSPAADLVPPLMSLDARVTLTSASGQRTVPLDAYFLDYKKDVRRGDEIITRIAWTPLPAGSANLFYKLARRKGDAITVAGVAVTIAAEDGRCARARMALGSVAPTVLRASRAEAMLENRSLSAELIEAAAREAAAAVRPIDDVRASAEYRSHAVHMLTRRLLTRAWDQVR